MKAVKKKIKSNISMYKSTPIYQNRDIRINMENYISLYVIPFNSLGPTQCKIVNNYK